MTHKLYKITFVILGEHFPEGGAQDRRSVPAKTCIDKHTHFISRTPPAPKPDASDPTIIWVTKHYLGNSENFKFTLGKITVDPFNPETDPNPNRTYLESIQPWEDTNARVLWKTANGYVMTVDK